MRFEACLIASAANKEIEVRVTWGLLARDLRNGHKVPVVTDTDSTVNGHALIVGMTGAGKTYTLKRMIREMAATDTSQSARFYVFDVHGDIQIEGASTVMFSEQTGYGLNPLRVNPDVHFGGVRKRVQGFMATMNSVMRELGPKQQATLRNVLYDVYERHGFRQDDPKTWVVNEDDTRLLSNGSDGRLYIDVPIGEKDDAKALGARWDAPARCWYIDPREYEGAITRWPPKTLSRTHPSIQDVLRTARYIMQQSFLGTGQEAITALGVVNKASAAYQRKLLEALRQGDKGFRDERLQADIEKAKQKAIDAFTNYAASISTGREVDDVLRYDSTDVLKSVVDRLENLNAIGIFKAKPPPFDPQAAVWRYDIRALGKEERKLFVLFRLEELFMDAVQRGEQRAIRDVIFLDEAHVFFDDDPDNILNTIAKEARKFGVALICISQSPTHFSEDFIAAVSTKVILGIDELYWKGSVTKMRVEEAALAWVRLQKSMLVQVKARGATRNDWNWVVMQEAGHA